MPPGAAAALLRDESYFPLADTTQLWLALASWAVLGLVLSTIGHFRNTGAALRAAIAEAVTGRRPGLRLASHSVPLGQDPGGCPAAVEVVDRDLAFGPVVDDRPRIVGGSLQPQLPRLVHGRPRDTAQLGHPLADVVAGRVELPPLRSRVEHPVVGRRVPPRCRRPTASSAGSAGRRRPPARP